ncbi:MAG: hypothetical protein ACR2GA_06450 [Chloroflexota bacterium]
MTEQAPAHQYQIGDTVLAVLDGARIPGVIENIEGERLMLQLAQPWMDEAGHPTDTVAVTAAQVESYVNEETGGQQALPG